MYSFIYFTLYDNNSIVFPNKQYNTVMSGCKLCKKTKRAFRLMKKFDHPKKGSSVHLSFKEEEKEEKEEIQEEIQED